MNVTPLHRRFAGQARLVRLLLWRIGDSTDLDACFATAREQGMLDEADEAFLRDQIDLEETHRGRLDELASIVDEETVTRLFRCADKLNRADSA